MWEVTGLPLAYNFKWTLRDWACTAALKLTPDSSLGADRASAEPAVSRGQMAIVWLLQGCILAQRSAMIKLLPQGLAPIKRL